MLAALFWAVGTRTLSVQMYLTCLVKMCYLSILMLVSTEYPGDVSKWVYLMREWWGKSWSYGSGL